MQSHSPSDRTKELKYNYALSFCVCVCSYQETSRTGVQIRELHARTLPRAMEAVGSIKHFSISFSLYHNAQSALTAASTFQEPLTAIVTSIPLIWWICCQGWQMVCDALITKSNCSQRVPKDPGLRGLWEKMVRHHRQKTRDSLPSSPLPWGIRGSIAERVRPQKRGGDKSFLVAVNFQPMWDPQVRHWAIVQAYLSKRKRTTRSSSDMF